MSTVPDIDSPLHDGHCNAEVFDENGVSTGDEVCILSEQYSWFKLDNREVV